MIHFEISVIRLWRRSVDGGKIEGQKVLLKVDLKVERLLQDVESSPKLSKAEARRIHVPKISIPYFNRNILNWTSFWEQFEVAVES